MSKAGKGDGVDAGAVGSEHPVPENIPHLSSPVNNNSNNSVGSGPGAGVAAQPQSGSFPKHTHHGSVPGIQAGSPIKESSFLQRETSADDFEATETKKDGGEPLAAGEGIPIRR